MLREALVFLPGSGISGTTVILTQRRKVDVWYLCLMFINRGLAAGSYSNGAEGAVQVWGILGP